MAVSDFIAFHEERVIAYLKEWYLLPLDIEEEPFLWEVSEPEEIEEPILPPATPEVVPHAKPEDLQPVPKILKHKRKVKAPTTPPPPVVSVAAALETPRGEIRYSDRGGNSLCDLTASEIVAMIERGGSEWEVLFAILKTNELSFSQKLMCYMRAKNLYPTDVYHAAQMDRRLFSKILSAPSYQPSKDTVIALSLALELDFYEASDFLKCAGYTLSSSIRRDVIIEYFIKHKVYHLDHINAFLHHAGEKTIGRTC